jgi:hypothetical protein
MLSITERGSIGKVITLSEVQFMILVSPSEVRLLQRSGASPPPSPNGCESTHGGHFWRGNPLRFPAHGGEHASLGCASATSCHKWIEE